LAADAARAGGRRPLLRLSLASVETTAPTPRRFA
jgi:hypothetical protein